MLKHMGNARDLSRMGRRTGVTSVEMALVAPLLLLLLFGIIEIGLLVSDAASLRQAAREGARYAAVGATPAAVDVRVASALTGMDPAEVTVLCECRSQDEGTGVFSAWTTMGTDDDENNAGAGDQIKVTLTQSHQLITGQLFPSVGDEAGDGTKTITGSITMRRE